MNKKLLLIIISLVLVSVIGLRAAVKNNSSSSAVQSVNTKNLHHLTMKIDGMYCASCPYNVENALKDLPGVANVTIGFVGKEIVNGTIEGRGEVIYDSIKTNPDKIMQAILPYKGTVLKDGTTSFVQLTPLSKNFGP